MHTLHTVLKRWPSLLLTGLVVAALAVAVSFVFPLEYRADMQLFILSRSRSGVDPYTVAKSAERIGENIAQVVDTTDFFDKVLSQPNHSIDRGVFDRVTERERRKKWQKTIDATVVYGTGVLTLSAYSTSPAQALDIASAAGDALVTRGVEYVGDDVSMKVINAPIVTRLPVRPNLLLNAVLGFGLGVLLSGYAMMRRKETGN